MNEPIRSPVSPKEIQAELTPATRIRQFHGIDIHSVTAHCAPSVMQEIGRIREVEFREEGGGTGQAVDIDDYDIGSAPFAQLVAWDPLHGEIIGMYRVAYLADRIDRYGVVHSPTARLFDFSPEFVKEYAPYTVELGRSVVNRSARKAVMGLYCVWAGLGAIVVERPDIRYFFGKITTYRKYDAAARNALHQFLAGVCIDPSGLLVPHPEFAVTVDREGTAAFADYDREIAFERLTEVVRSRGESVPPLFISYLELSRTMLSFGTAQNPHFGNVFETAILVTIAEINRKQRRRFIDNFVPARPAAVAV